MFEVSKHVLSLDPGSLLAALCNGEAAAKGTHQEQPPPFTQPLPSPHLTRNHPDESPLDVDREDQVVVVDRDWWLFR